jgi:hypothetical protein
MTIHRIRRGDTLPPLRATLTGQDGAAINLENSTVELHLARAGRVVVREAVILDEAKGIVRYEWSADDWEGEGLSVGSWHLEWQVSLDTGDVITAPPTGHDVLEVEEDLA